MQVILKTINLEYFKNAGLKGHIICCWLEKESDIGNLKVVGVPDGDKEDTSDSDSEIPVQYVCMDIKPSLIELNELFFISKIKHIF